MMNFLSRYLAPILSLIGFFIRLSSQELVPLELNFVAVDSSCAAWADVNNDGRMDIFYSGRADSTNEARLVISTENGFESIDHIVQPVRLGSASWGDLNNDNYPDLLLTGYTGDSIVTKIYLSSNGNLVDSQQQLHGVSAGQDNGHWVDIDQDGDQDVFLTGWNGRSGIAVFYENRNGQLHLSEKSLPQLTLGAAAFGDYDSDGDFDLFLSGRTDERQPFSGVFLNDRGKFLPDDATILKQLYLGAAAWTDYNADGLLDLSYFGLSTNDIHSEFYLNRNGILQDSKRSIRGFFDGQLISEDMNNDGDLDLILTGRTPHKILDQFSPSQRSRRWFDTAAAFTASHQGSYHLARSTVAVADFDADGSLDFFTCGGNIYKTRISDIIRSSGIENQIPTIPSQFKAIVHGANVQFSWQSSQDKETPANGLTYNLRIGRSQSGTDVMSPLSHLETGRRKIPGAGNVGHATDWVIYDLEPGLYYASVQAIDYAHAGSPFSQTISFRITTAPAQKSSVSGDSVAISIRLDEIIPPGQLLKDIPAELNMSAEEFTDLPANTNHYAWGLIVGLCLLLVVSAFLIKRNARSQNSIPPIIEISQPAPSRRYKVAKPIGQGSIATIYQGFDTQLRRKVAIKVIQLDSTLPVEEVQERVSRLRMEARTTAQLRHDGIIEIFDMEEDHHNLFVIMELIQGESILQKLKRDHHLSAQEASSICIQICSALEAAHQQGLVHRDIKPSNIMLSNQGNIKLLDFGIVKILAPAQTMVRTATGIRLGSPTYMSPEQIEGQSIDHRTDIFSLGVVLYEMLSGRQPFVAKDNKLSTLFDTIINDDPPHLGDVPEALAQIVFKMLAKDVSSRPQTASEVARQIKAASSFR